MHMQLTVNASDNFHSHMQSLSMFKIYPMFWSQSFPVGYKIVENILWQINTSGFPATEEKPINTKLRELSWK